MSNYIQELRKEVTRINTLLAGYRKARKRVFRVDIEPDMRPVFDVPLTASRELIVENIHRVAPNGYHKVYEVMHNGDEHRF